MEHSSELPEAAKHPLLRETIASAICSLAAADIKPRLH
jgi:hypothetical protein